MDKQEQIDNIAIPIAQMLKAGRQTYFEEKSFIDVLVEITAQKVEVNVHTQQTTERVLTLLAK